MIAIVIRGGNCVLEMLEEERGVARAMGEGTCEVGLSSVTGAGVNGGIGRKDLACCTFLGVAVEPLDLSGFGRVKAVSGPTAARAMDICGGGNGGGGWSRCRLVEVGGKGSGGVSEEGALV